MRHLLAVIGLCLALPCFASIDAYQFSSPQNEALYNELIDEVRCPKCQNQTVAESDADLSQDIKDKIFEMVEQGKSKDDILAFMIDRYGYFVHYQPPVKKTTWVLWYGPFLFLLAAVLGVFFWMRARNKALRDEPSELDEAQQARMQALLNDNKDNQ